MDSEFANLAFTIVFGLGTLWSLATGRIFFKYAGTVTRSEQPMTFWILILGNVSLTAVCGYFWIEALNRQ